MRVKFLRDFQSARTREVFYPKGTEVELEEGATLVAEGVAKEIKVKPPVEEKPVEPKP